MSEEEKCRNIIKRAAWRLQYRQRVLRKQEGVELNDFYNVPTKDAFEAVISDISFNYIISNLDSDKGKYILISIYQHYYKEDEVAKKLKISQQAVNKWKKKSLRYLKETIDL